MRPLATGEFARLTDARLWIFVRVEVTDADGAWQDLTALAGADRLLEVTWSDTEDQAVQSGTLSLEPGRGTDALAPLLEASLRNRDGADAYAPLLNPGRRLRISTAELAPGATPVTGDWREVFLGVIDDVSWHANPITVTFRDLGAELLALQIETVRDYGSDEGVAVETVMQAILDDNGTGVTLSVPTSPGWMLLPYAQATGTSVLQALRDLALQIGWDVRYRYGSDDESHLTLFVVDRDPTAPLVTFTADHYHAVTDLTLSAVDVRNVVEVTYPGGAAPVVREDAGSIAVFGRRFLGLGLDATSNINTEAEAEALGDAALADLAQPPLAQTIELLYFWAVELGDCLGYAANGVHYDSDQALGVVGITHRLAGGSGTTSLISRGKPRGAYRRWLTAGAGGAAGTQAEVSSVDVRINPLTDEAEISGVVNPVAQSLRWWLSAALDALGTDPVAAAPAIIANLTGEAKAFSLRFALPDGKGVILFLRPTSTADGTAPLGLLYQIPVARTPRTELHFEPRDPTGRIRSDWARITFTVRPSIPPVPGSAGVGTVTSATTASLTDSAQAWTADQFAYDPVARQTYYVRVGTQIARIVGNTGDTLTLAPPLDTVPSGDYAIYAGATLYALVADGVPASFRPVIDELYLQRAAGDVVLEYYSEIALAGAEPVNRFTLDADETPEMDGIEAQEIAPGLVSVRVVGYDDDVKDARVYAKKGGWPTLDGTEQGVIDPMFGRYDGPVGEAAFEMAAGAGTWYYIGLPVNSYNDVGPRVTTTLTVTGAAAPGDPGGTPTEADGLSALLVESVEASGVRYHRLSWQHSAGLGSPNAAHEIRVYGYRSDEGAAAKRLLSPADRRAWQDAGAGADTNPADDGEVTAGVGSLVVAVGTAGSDVSRLMYYTIELWVDGTLQATYSAARADLFGLPAPSGLALTASRSSTYGGKPYITNTFGYTRNEPAGSAWTELWERANNATFDAGADDCNMIARVKDGSAFEVTRLLDAAPWNAGNPVTNWSYWVRNTLADGSAATATDGPVTVTYELP